MVREALTAAFLGGLDPGEAAAHFIDRRAEGLSSHDEALLRDWLAESDDHQRAFAGADRVWRSFADAEGDEILAAMRAHALAPRRPVWTDWRILSAAAAAVVAVIGALALFPGTRHAAPPAPQSSAIQYASARGEVKEIRLPDGSRMTLDADSAAAARFGASSRSIALIRGRALFAVTPDPSRPFAVTAAGQRVVAVGTRFDVNLASGTLTVTLLEGRLRVAPSGAAAKAFDMQSGQQLVQRGGQVTVRTIGPDADSTTHWRTGLVDFDDQPLAEAAAVMNRYGGDQIVIRDPAVAAMRVSGQFRAGDAGRFAQTLASVYRLRTVRREHEIELIRPG